MKLKVNLTISDSSLSVTKPPQDQAMADIAIHWGHLRQWLYGGQRAVNKSYLPSVSVSGQDQNIRSCVTKMMVCTLNWMMTWWSEDMVWHYPDKTFFVKNCLWMLWRVVSDCPPRFMTGTNCNSHDVIYLKRRTFFRNSPQYCTGTKKTNIRWASFSSYTTLSCVKFLNDFKRLLFCGLAPEFQNQFTS